MIYRLGEQSYAGGLYIEVFGAVELRILWLQSIPCLCALFLFLLLLLLLDCRLLVSVLSPHEVEGGGESTTGEGETVF